MAKFLSEEWLTQAREIREEYEGRGGAPPHKMRMNLIVTEVPEDVADGDVEAQMDTTDGDMDLDVGHLENPDLTVTLPYEVAKAILVEGNPAAGMQAFMAGQIKVQGDMSKLMAMQTAQPDDVAVEIASRIKAITD